MSQPRWQRLVLSLTVAVGVLCVLVIVYLITRLAPAAFIGAADLLPAEQTVLMIGDADQGSLQSWRAWLPMPSSFPTETGAVMALLDLNDDRAWVTLIPDPGSDPPFIVSAESPEAKAMVLPGRGRLGDMTAFAMLKSDTHGQPWAWWSAELLENLPAIPLSVRSVVAAGIVARAENGGTTIAVLPRSPLRLRQAPLAQPGGDLTLALSDPQATVNAFDRLLPADTTLPAYGLLRARLKTIVGESVSPGFDLLPLLTGPSSLAVTRTGSGTAWTLRAETEEPARAMAIFARARSNAGSVTVDRRQIEGFEVNEVREGASATNEQDIAANGWEGRLRSDGGTIVCALTRGREVLMTNHQAFCTAPTDSTISADTAFLQGSINAAILKELRALQLPGMIGAILQTVPNEGSTWTVMEANGVIRMKITPL